MIDYKLSKTKNIKESFSSLWDIVNALRDPVEGCPWDRQQMPKDIIRSMQGEIYEYIDALEEKDCAHESEEIGDVFLNLFLLLKIQDQNGDYDANTAILDACEKYIRRHPHVFSNVIATTSSEVIKNWQDIKKNVEGRKDNPDDFFANIERNAPELDRCYKISKKAAKCGFEWEDTNGVYEKIQEELNEVRNAETPEQIEEELGDVLFTVVNLCRRYKVKPQDALSVANNKFIKRFNIVCKAADEQNLVKENLSPDQWDNLWKKAKEKLSNEEN